MNNLFPQLPDNARVWIYQSNRVLTAVEVKAIWDKAMAFVQSWSSHSRKVDADAAVVYDRFVILAADEAQFQVSGCGIDSSVHFIKAIGHEYGIDFFDRFHIAWKEGEHVHDATRHHFEDLLTEGKINEHTIVFNNLISNREELLRKWQIPLKESWHYKVFVS